MGERLSRLFRQVKRTFHTLIALVFIMLALAGAGVALNLWQDYRQTPSQGLWDFIVVAGFSVALFLFGLYAFAKARSVR
jgi:cytochrome b subunit of formate dehydrogenase